MSSMNKADVERGTPLLLPLLTALTGRPLHHLGCTWPSAFIKNLGETASMLDKEGPTLPDDKDRQRLRERLKDVEKRLQTHQPVALKWKEAGKLLMVVLEDQTILRFRVTDVRGLSDIKSIKIDQSVAEQSQERFLSADIDVTCQLMVASTQSGRLLLYDARKYDMGAEADHLGASGTCLLDAQDVILWAPFMASAKLMLETFTSHGRTATPDARMS